VAAIDPDLTPALALPVADALALLERGELSIEGRLVDASNATLYCAVTAAGVTAACVYKPIAGERPLWDFPDGTLAEREVAAYEVSAATGSGGSRHGAAVDRHRRACRSGRAHPWPR
jgi:hypothetical protein